MVISFIAIPGSGKSTQISKLIHSKQLQDVISVSIPSLYNRREFDITSYLTDLGTQYTSHKFQEVTSKMGVVHSFSRKGNPYDNACIESFHSILKKEEVHHNKYYDFNVARRAIRILV